MKKFLIAAAAFATLATPSLASAQQYRHQAPRVEHTRQATVHRAQPRVTQRTVVHRTYVVNGRHYVAQPGPRWDPPRNYHRQEWRRGQYVQRDYRRVVVTDYQRRHLARPAYGQEWVRVDGDALLIAAATGLVLGVVAGAFQ